MRIIDITKLENSQISADIIMTGEIKFIMFDFQHLNELMNKLEDLKTASGIYVLIGEKELYVGQADVFMRRLTHHQKDVAKGWINRVIMFTNKEQTIGKDMLNYLESKLIAYFKDSERTLLNGNGGQTSSIFLQNQIKSDNLIEHFFDMLNLFSIDLMTLDTEEVAISIQENQSFLVEFNGKKFDLNHGKQIERYLDFILEIYTVQSDFIISKITNGIPSWTKPFGTVPLIHTDGMTYSKPLKIGNEEIQVFSNLSKLSKHKKMISLLQELEKYQSNANN